MTPPALETRPVLPPAERERRVKWGMCPYCLGALADGDQHDVARTAIGEVCVITHRPR